MRIFKAGIFKVGYRKGFIRRVLYGNVEVIRMIYMTLRDQNWNTYEPIIENENINEESDSFSVHYDCFHELNGKRIFRWHSIIQGMANGEISFEIFGEALADLLKNRAGLCILHPIKHTAGSPCQSYHEDGTVGNNYFPIMISAENPFKYLKSFRWRCEDTWYALSYEGDRFETEDQRNWCDASYKTFCTPLDIPFPVQLKAGDKVHQKVIFRPDGNLRAISGNGDNAVKIVAGDRRFQLPKIGVAASTERETVSGETVKAIQQLNLNHYRIEVSPHINNWIRKFKLDCNNAKALGLPLEIALHIGNLKELQEFYDQCIEVRPLITHIILLSIDSAATKPALIDEIPALKKQFPAVKIGAGTDYNYRELNVNRFDGSGLDFISYSIDPQEHATDDLTIIENMEAQADTIMSARDIYGTDKSVHISSLTLKKRFNPAATVPSNRVLSNELKADPRQITEFGAAFTLGSIKCLSMANANSVTLYQTEGSQGIVSLSGQKYPTYHILQQILTQERGELIETESSRPLTCDGLVVNGRQSKLIMVNYTEDKQHVIFQEKEYLLGPYATRVINIDGSVFG
jgi:hypothetical protein